MDIVGGLTAARLAIGLAKDLKDIDRSVDDATFKLKVAELTSALADTQIALSDAKLTLNEADQQIHSLKIELKSATSGEVCPKCLKGRMKLIETKPHIYYGLGNSGVEDWEYACENVDCGFKQTKIHDPQGLIPKMIAKN